MLQYLTPAKVGLLTLIELYTEESVPNDAIVPVLDFISSRLLDCDLPAAATGAPRDRWAMAESTIRFVLSVKQFEQLLAPFAAADRLPGRRLWDRFLEKLWGIDSLHTLQEFFEQLPNLLVRTKDELRRLAELGEEPPSGILLSRVSPFGTFVRRSHLEFSRLPFNKAADLWKAFVRYRQPTASYWMRRNPHYDPLSFDSVLMTGAHEWGEATDELAVVAYGTMVLGVDDGDVTPVGTDDIENLLEMQVELLHRYGNRVPHNIKELFQGLLKHGHPIPSLVHYLNYSDSWRAGDFPTSFDHLHRYFDYTMQNRNRLFYQYALMNLGILQADFGCYQEALTTMLEAVTTARENRDTACLNFALNWLFHFGRAHPKLVRELKDNNMLGGGKEPLSYLRIKAKEAGMWVLWSSALLAEAKVELASGQSISAAIENMVRSARVMLRWNVRTMAGAQLSVATSLWDRLGLANMSTMTCEVFLRCHTDEAVFEDILKATCRHAGLLAGRGKYEEAFAKLDALSGNPLRSAKPKQYWHLYRGLLKLRRELHRNNIEAADHLLSQLLQAGTGSLEPDMVFIIDLLHVETLTRRGEFEAAFNKIDRLAADLRDDDRDISLRIRLLLSKAHLYDRMGRPEKGFTISMRAASMAWRARLVSLLWQAIGAVSNILNALSEFSAASDLLVAALPRCLETDNVYVAGTLYSLLADAWTGQAGEADAKGPSQALKRTEFLTKANEALEFAFRNFSLVEDVEKQCETLAKQATIMRAMGDIVRSEDYATRYLALRKDVTMRNE